METGFKPDYADQTGFFDPTKFGHKTTFIGCGGINATALMTLSTLGLPEIEIFDRDVVEPRNVAATTMFGPGDVGQLKVEVAQRELLRLGVPKVTIHAEHFDAETHGSGLDGIVISGVDSMEARKAIWPAIEWNGLVPLYLDGRIGGEILQLNALNPCDPDHVSWYTDFELFSDEEGTELPCAMRNVVYPSVVLSGMMASTLAGFSRGEAPRRQIIMDMGARKILTDF